MKKIGVLILGIVLAGSVTNAQSVKDALVPTDVKTTLFSKYPQLVVDKIDTVDIKWIKQKTSYLAQYHKDNEDHWVTISKNGDWIQTRDQIEVNGLPKTVTSYLKEHYPEQKASAAYKIESTSCTVTYLVKLGSLSLHFDTYGTCTRPKDATKKTIKTVTKTS